jgi:hypothetical protein
VHKKFFVNYQAKEAAEKQFDSIETIKRRTSGPEGRDYLIDFDTGDKSPAYRINPRPTITAQLFSVFLQPVKP